MDTDKKLDTSEAGPSGSAVPKSASRRRLLRAGVGAAPVVLTMVSSPVRATGGLPGKTASAFASVALGATSGNSIKVTTCTGDSPTTWHTNCPTGWPSGCTQKTDFPTCLGVSGSSYPDGNGGGKLKDALVDPNCELARYMAAAYLNMQSGKATVITLNQMRDIWNSYYTGGSGYWIPVGSTKWTWTDTKNWLTTCGIVGV